MRILLIAYDNDSHIHWFPLGLAYIASALRNAGHEVVVYNKDMYHYSPEQLTWYLDNNYFHVVALGVVGGYWQYKELLNISRAINKSKMRPHYVIGGHGPSPEPKYFMERTGADAVVCGEGEVAVLDAVNRKGIFSSTPVKDIDSLPSPAWDLFPMDYYTLMREPNILPSERCMPMITGRGCPFHCNFCYRMVPGIRLRSVDSVVQEIEYLKSKYCVSYISFMDELFMSSENRAVELSEAFITAGLKIKWSCMGRLNFAKPEVLKVMKRAGCVFINYGIECMDDEILKNMNKNLTVGQIINGIEATLKEGISPGFNIIFGNIGENQATLAKGVRFLMKYDDQAQLRTIRPVTPYPGSPLYYKAIEEGKLGGVADFYENKHKNSDLPCVNFTTLSDKELNEVLYKANKTLLWNYHQKVLGKQVEQFHKLYFEGDDSFRGLRQT